jgi:hypothetical protein
LRRLVKGLLVGAIAATQFILPTAPAPAAEEGVHSPNMKHVANLKYELRYGKTSNAGTDVEFTKLRLGGKLRDFALAGSYRNGLQIIDISKPTKPKIAGVYDCAIAQGDVQVFKRNKRTYVTYTADDISSETNITSDCYKFVGAAALNDTPYGTFVADVTNPSKPKTVSFVPWAVGSHNQTVHPNGRFLYNSNSDLDGSGAIEIADISNFDKPKMMPTLELQTGLDSHDITFNAKGTRAYSAAVSHTLVLNTKNPGKPEIIGRIIDPAINIHHQSDPITINDPILGKKTFLVVTDELAGAAGNGACPGGGLHVYDITGDLERTPVKVGFYSMPEVKPAGDGQVGGESLTCTSHVLRMYPKQKLMTIAWYNAGVRVIDISGLAGVSAGVAPSAGSVGAGMKEIGYYYFPNSDTWSAKANKFSKNGSAYIYGNDFARGFDVYRFDAKAQESRNPGTWLTPSAAASLLTPNTQPIGPTNGPICLIRALNS